MADRASIPVIPLRGTVLFPGVATPITAGRVATLRAVEAALRDQSGEKQIFAVTQRDDAEHPSQDGLYAIGVFARVTQTERVEGGLRIILACQERATSLRYYSEQDGVIRARAVALPDIPVRAGEELRMAPLIREIREQAMEYGRLRGAAEELLKQFIGDIQDPSTLVNHIAFYLDLATTEKQSLLETLAPEQRLRLLAGHLYRHLGIAKAEERIRSSVRAELGERQRELYLREQLKAIQKELGEEEEMGLAERIEARIEAAAPPPEVMVEVRRDVARLKRMGRDTSPEAQVISNWLEWVADLPWQRRTTDRIGIAEARQILDADHHGLTDIKERLLEFLAVRKLRADHESMGRERARAICRGPILLFVGPPGTGKTSIAESIARALGRTIVRVSLGGARDEADIRGHRRTYIGAMPGRLLTGIKRAGTRNPVCVLDEIDKLSASYQGDPGAALLEVLDPAQNSGFVDHYLGVPFDLSEVLFLCTANTRQGIPAPLLDRMEAWSFAGYTEHEKLEIARRYLIPRQLSENALPEAYFQVGDRALQSVITRYTREAGVRQLERTIASLARKVVRRMVEGEATRASIDTEESVRELLGRPRIHVERRRTIEEPGVATGMYYTEAGGDIMHVEVCVMPGRGELLLTGQLGDVMKESGRAALTYARTHAKHLGVPDSRLRDRDFHIHVPAGAVPKDGPSAGVTIALSLLSALSLRPVRSDLAMTGEITLRGRVLPIGGVKEKILGAHRAGMTEILLPEDNEADLEEVPEEVRRELRFHFVKTLDEATGIALLPSGTGGGQLAKVA